MDAQVAGARGEGPSGRPASGGGAPVGREPGASGAAPGDEEARGAPAARGRCDPEATPGAGDAGDRPRRLRAVFLDAGNTLLALDYDLIAGRISAAGHPVTPEAVRAAEQRARVRLDPHLRRPPGAGPAASTEARDIFRLYVRYLLEELRIPWDAAAERIADNLRAANPPAGLWCVGVPEAAGVLAGLRARGLRLAVVSNSNGTVAGTLRAVGLAGYLDAIVDSALVGVEKPDPRIFRHAAAVLGVAPEEAIHVGDLYAVDVLGARAAGCAAILLDPAGAWGAVDCPRAPDLPAAAALIACLAG